jgi:hypothetical protein
MARLLKLVLHLVNERSDHSEAADDNRYAAGCPAFNVQATRPVTQVAP